MDKRYKRICKEDCGTNYLRYKTILGWFTNASKYRVYWLISCLQFFLITPLHAEWAAGIPTGTEFPQINAQDHTSRVRTNKSLIGEHGLLFFFNRSSDW